MLILSNAVVWKEEEGTFSFSPSLWHESLVFANFINIHLLWTSLKSLDLGFSALFLSTTVVGRCCLLAQRQQMSGMKRRRRDFFIFSISLAWISSFVCWAQLAQRANSAENQLNSTKADEASGAFGGGARARASEQACASAPCWCCPLCETNLQQKLKSLSIRAFRWGILWFWW